MAAAPSRSGSPTRSTPSSRRCARDALELENDPAYVADILRAGNARANEVAEATLDEVRERMGMVYT